MKKNVSLGISTCPNDTYIFGALINGLIKSKFIFQTVLDDVEVLNNFALAKKLDVVKVSYGVYPLVKNDYLILKSGGAISYGFGPVLVSRNYDDIESLRKKRVAIPGAHTTAFRIFKYFYGNDFEFVQLRFDKIIPAVIKGEVDAGLLIHEGRFVYKRYDLKLIADFGELWEKEFDLPIPLGAILIRRSLVSYASDINKLINESILYADRNYERIYPFIKKYAQELDEDIIKKHIKAFVNENSRDLSDNIRGISKFLDVDESVFV